MTKSNPQDKRVSSSSTWLINWFTHFTKPTVPAQTKLPWKKNKSSISVTEPIEIQRPSITISTASSDRRGSQQTLSNSSLTSDDQYSTTAASYYQRRDSSERSMLSELWSKAKRRHPHYPRFQTSKKSHDTISCPSSYHRYYTSHIPQHLKRHSISSSFLTNSVDNTPCVSRPNSIIYTPSQPTSPFIKNQSSEDVIDHFLLEDPIQERWTIKHELIKLAIDGLFSIPEMVTLPLSIEKHVLQIGCGDAAWALDVASQYPRWMIVGLDDDNEYSSPDEFPILSTAATTIITKRNIIPKNFKLIRCHSLLQGLRSLPDNTFDFIESRFLVLTYTFEQYQQLMTECLRVCKPGGYIELMEMDMRIYHQRLLSCPVTHLLNNEVISVIESKKLDPRLARRLLDLVSPTITTKAKYVSLPIGVWGGRLGVIFRDDIHHLIESFQPHIAELNSVQCRTEDELESKIEMMDQEVDANRSFMNLHLLFISKSW
ncbi:uncharacterized protein B0P05DRAFT_560825 [Gilbertella persicaria]|uniref:uncharacterized protein n=1 Tax=Gilbertella persicaria TaxID=101096 RepID=UPI0022202EF5|nr:uncharacterized protein B0P05DRAFT_560825 [Gilbertella persicaria]KAI8054939.1 hypothetical protein B0P05DRAFT_560825 [Gilbertella persicaria]